MHLKNGKRGKTRASEARLVLVWVLIGWENGASFGNQSEIRSKPKPNQTQIAFKTQLKTSLLTQWQLEKGWPNLLKVPSRPWKCCSSSWYGPLLHGLLSNLWTGSRVRKVARCIIMALEQPTTLDRILVAQITVLVAAIYSPLLRSQNLELSPNINYFFI